MYTWLSLLFLFHCSRVLPQRAKSTPDLFLSFIIILLPPSVLITFLLSSTNDSPYLTSPSPPWTHSAPFSKYYSSIPSFYIPRTPLVLWTSYFLLILPVPFLSISSLSMYLDLPLSTPTIPLTNLPYIFPLFAFLPSDPALLPQTHRLPHQPVQWPKRAC